MEPLKGVRACICAAIACACVACANQDVRRGVARPLADAPAAPMQPADPRWMTDANHYRPVWATRVLGEPVVDNRGGHFGMLRDVAIDMTTGDVRYAVIARASAASAAGGELQFPVAAGELHLTEKGTLFIDVSGTPVVISVAGPAEYRVSRLLGRHVEGLDGRRAGRIIDVVIDLERQRVHYAVMRIEPHAGLDPDLAFAVPIDALSARGADGDVLAIDATREHLARLVGFDMDRWPALDDPRYLGVIDQSFAGLRPRTARGAEANLGVPGGN